MPVGVGVGGDDLLIDQPGDFDREVLLDVENSAEPGVLMGREQPQTGAGDAPNPVERIPGVPTPAQGLLLDALTDQIELDPSQRDDMERSITVIASGMTSVTAVL